MSLMDEPRDADDMTKELERYRSRIRDLERLLDSEIARKRGPIKYRHPDRAYDEGFTDGLDVAFQMMTEDTDE